MNCPKCANPTTVYDSRSVEKGTVIRRRRKCLTCGHRIRTYEAESYEFGHSVNGRTVLAVDRDALAKAVGRAAQDELIRQAAEPVNQL